VKTFILGLVIGLLIPAAIGYGYFRFGFAPMAASAAPIPFEKTMARMALRAHIANEAPKKDAPVPADESNLTQGATIYAENCAFCHGLPGQKTTMAAKGMFPPPPQLFAPDEMVTDNAAGETYWKVANGIRMTGMPGFGEMLNPTQMWQVSLLLAKADKLPDTTKAALAQAGAPLAQSQNQPSSPRHPSRKKK
jgi:thiosulfate dehydrogenase